VALLDGIMRNRCFISKVGQCLKNTTVKLLFFFFENVHRNLRALRQNRKKYLVNSRHTHISESDGDAIITHHLVNLDPVTLTSIFGS
jgi:hypothetical protein